MGLPPTQLAAARLYRSTVLDVDLANGAAVQPRIEECDPGGTNNVDADATENVTIPAEH